MHPLLLTIPLPSWPIALSPMLVVVALVGLGVAVVAQRRAVPELVAVGLVIAFAGATGAVALRGAVYVPRGIDLTTFGALLAVALAAGWGLTGGLARNDGLPRRSVEAASFAALLGGLVGGRLQQVLEGPAASRALAAALDLRAGGLAFPGALAGGLVAGYLALAPRHRLFLAWADVAAPAIAFGAVLGRLGSYAMGGGFGLPLASTAPRALAALGTFPRWEGATLGGRGSPAWVEQVTRGQIPATAAGSLPVHPVELYLAAAAVIVLAAVLWARRGRSFTGECLFALVFWEAALRFPIELLGDDPDRWLIGPRLAAVHALGLGLVVAAAAYVLGPSRAIVAPQNRRRFQAGALGAAVLTWGAVGLSGAGRFVVAPSFGQWVALATLLAVAAAWEPLARSRREEPPAGAPAEAPAPPSA